MKLKKFIAPASVLVVAGLIVSLSSYHVGLIALAGTNVLLCLGLAFLLAAGQLSLGHAAFFGTGAYVSAILARDYGLAPLMAIVLAILVCIPMAYVIGRITLRLRGHYLPLATLAWGIAIYVCFVAAIDLTGGASGMSDIPALRFLGVEFGTRAMAGLTWVIVGLAFVAFCRIYRGRLGRVARAIKSSPTMAAAFGVDVAAVKVKIFVMSAALAALAGALYTFYMRFVSPSSFSIEASFSLLIMVVLGGYIHPVGAILGVIAFTAIELGAEYLFANLLGLPGQMEAMLFGVILIVALLRWPNGLLTWIRPERISSADQGDASGPASFEPRVNAPRRVLKVDEVSKQFGGLSALKGVSLEVPLARITGLIGPNGAGKSTLFNVMSSVLPATLGRVTIDDKQLPARAYEVIGQGVARTFQHVQLVQGLNVLQNVMIGGYSQGRAGLFAAAFGLDRAEERNLASQAQAALAKVGLADVAETGGEPAIGKPTPCGGGTRSHGQAGRAASG